MNQFRKHPYSQNKMVIKPDIVLTEGGTDPILMMSNHDVPSLTSTPNAMDFMKYRNAKNDNTHARNKALLYGPKTPIEAIYYDDKQSHQSLINEETKQYETVNQPETHEPKLFEPGLHIVESKENVMEEEAEEHSEQKELSPRQNQKQVSIEDLLDNSKSKIQLFSA